MYSKSYSGPTLKIGYKYILFSNFRAFSHFVSNIASFSKLFLSPSLLEKSGRHHLRPPSPSSATVVVLTSGRRRPHLRPPCAAVNRHRLRHRLHQNVHLGVPVKTPPSYVGIRPPLLRKMVKSVRLPSPATTDSGIFWCMQDHH